MFSVITHPQHLGTTLKGLRKQKGLTQVEMAKLSGLGQKTIFLLETEPWRCSVDSLLPENDNIRQRLAKRFSTGTEAFPLLAEIGRDCVGALEILPDGESPPATEAIRSEPLSDAQVGEHLAGTLTAPTFAQDDDGFRISIADAQEKTALLWHQEKWCRPLGTTPTTHIFKLPMGQMPGRIDLSTSVENEWLCHRLLRAFDLFCCPGRGHAVRRDEGALRRTLRPPRARRWSPEADHRKANLLMNASPSQAASLIQVSGPKHSAKSLHASQLGDAHT